MDLSGWNSAWIIALFILGIVALLGGGHALVVGSSGLARRLGVPPLIIGLTVVSLGTSMPEFLVSFFAALKGNTDVALGNIIGSNISNIGLVLGISALCRPIVVNKRLLKFELPLVLAVSLYFWFISSNGSLGRIDGLTLLIGFLIYLAVVIHHAKGSSNRSEELAKESKDSKGILPILSILAIGIISLSFGANWVVDSASEMSRRLGVPELILALTVIAIGTSLPELATSVIAALKGESDLSIGNILGSNIFNMMAIAGPTALANPLPVSGEVIHYHLPVMVGLTLILFPLLWTGRQIGRREGAFLLLVYIAIFISWTL